MAAPKGVKYWLLAEKMGRNPKYTPDTLWSKAIEYFEWVDNNPLNEEKLSSGAVFKMNKMRAMTIRGFCLFAGITRTTFDEYDSQNNFSDITTRIRDIIYQQKFEGAAADLLNPSIIARELGLSEKTEHTGKDGKDLIPEDIRRNTGGMTAVELVALINGE